MVAEQALAGIRTRVDAAVRLWNRTPDLIRSERTLFALQGCFPRYDADSTQIKVVALQSLDSSHTFLSSRWAAHVEGVLARVDPRTSGPELVEALAALPGLKPADGRRALAMASRFAHYFVDADRFPILDAWIESELGRLAPAPHVPSIYPDFSRRYADVAAHIGLSRPRRLGAYLWLASQYRVWLRNPRRSIQHAARTLFETSAPELGWIAPFDDPREACAAA